MTESKVQTFPWLLKKEFTRVSSVVSVVDVIVDESDERFSKKEETHGERKKRPKHEWKRRGKMEGWLMMTQTKKSVEEKMICTAQDDDTGDFKARITSKYTDTFSALTLVR